MYTSKGCKLLFILITIYFYTKVIFIKKITGTDDVLDEGSASSVGTNVGNVSGQEIIIGKDIKTGDISINIVYETIRNFGLNLLPSTYFKDNQKTDENYEKWKKGFPLRLPSVMKGRISKK